MAAVLTASLVLTLLVFSFSVSADQKIIRAEPRDDVILTCRAAENKHIVVLWWNRPDLESDQHVILYRNNKIILEHQSPSFKDRVSLLDVKNGDVSLVLKDVTTDDTGTYECRVVQEGGNHKGVHDADPISIIYLRVEPGQRIITVEPGENVILTCRAAEIRTVIIVEWRRTDLESDQPVLLYRNSQLDPELQSPSFKNRVDLLDVKNRDVSLVLKNVTTDNTGTYECRVVQRGNNHRKRSLLDTDPISTIDLIVEPGNKEKQKMDGGNKDGVNRTGLIVGLPVFAVVTLLVVAAVLYKRSRGSSPRSNPPPAAADVEETLTGPDESNPPC